MKKLIFILLFSTLLLSCASTTGYDAKVSTSDYSGKSVVDIHLHSNDCNPLFSTQCASLGAQWREEQPDKAFIIVQVQGISSVSGVSFMIDGKETVLKASHLTDINTGQYGSSSKNKFITDLSVIRDLSTSKKAYARISSANGEYFENRIVDGEESGWSYHAMKRFIAKVDEVKGKDK